MSYEILLAFAIEGPGERRMLFGAIPVEAPPVATEVVMVPESPANGRTQPLYIGRVFDACSGEAVMERPYRSTYPHLMGRWFYRETGVVPPDELGGQEAIKHLQKGEQA